MRSKAFIGSLVAAAAVLLVVAVLFVWRPAKPVERLVLCCPESVQPLFQELSEKYRASHEGAPSIEVTSAVDELCTADFIGEQLRSGAADIAVARATSGGFSLDSAGLADLSGSISLSDDAPLFAPLDADGPYALPLCGDVPVLLCNTAALDRAGLSVPESRGGFLGACLVLASQDVAPFALELNEAGQWNAAALLDSCLLNVDYQADSGLVVNDALHGGFYDYQYLAENLQQIMPSRDSAPVGHAALLQAFKGGSYAMIVGTSAEYEALRAEGFPCAAVPLYGQIDGARMAWSTAYALSVSQKAYGSETRDFLNWMLSADAQQMIHASLGHVPAGSGVQVEEGLQGLYTPSPTTEWRAVSSPLRNLSPAQKEACASASDAAFDGSLNEDALLEALKH